MTKSEFIEKLVQLQKEAQASQQTAIYQHEVDSAFGREAALDDVIELVEDLDD